MYYFAYGSNLSLEHMRRICGWHCHFLGRAKLPGFDICIDNRGYLNMEIKEGAEVYGILYSIDEEGLVLLDEFEGYPEVFKREEVTVFDENSVKYKAQTYIESTGSTTGKQIREEFIRRVIAAAYENRLPDTWIHRLESLGKGREKI